MTRWGTMWGFKDGLGVFRAKGSKVAGVTYCKENLYLTSGDKQDEGELCGAGVGGDE